MTIKNWKSALINPEAQIFEAIKVIDSSSLQIALVVDDDSKLVGTITDGDIRRSILKNVSLTDPVISLIRKPPIVASIHDDSESILSLMQERDIHHIPIVDEGQRLVDLKVLIEMIQSQEKSNSVVIMAGGLGSRLKPLTDECPKPLLKIGGKPLLETIINNLISFGFRRFFISVNFKSEMIENYFEDGAKWNVEIQYLREDEKLGTAGALSKLPNIPEDKFLVMNGDLLTSINFSQLINFHTNQNADATMAVKEYDFQVPYGVAKVHDNLLVNLDEKPVQRFFVNGGIYVLEPAILELVPKNQHFNMTDLFDRMLEKSMKVATFPIHEYWLDIGKFKDFEKANGDFYEFFSESKSNYTIEK